LPENFLPDGLNAALKELTSIDHMINILEIYMNQLGFYVTDAKQAEKKALNFLIIYAVIFNRHKLAKILWKRSEDPLALALVCSLIYKNLLFYVQEHYLKSQIEKWHKDFDDAAINVLDASFKENDQRAYSILSYKHPNWNDLTLLELAYNAKNKAFIAHPCCQKILTKRLFGSIQIRDVDNGFIEFPAWIKVTLSAFFILPMYYWIIFPLKEEKTNKISKYRKKKKLSNDFGEQQNKNQQNSNMTEDYFDNDEKDEELQEAEETKKELNKKLINEMKKNQKHSQLLRYKKSIDINLATSGNTKQMNKFNRSSEKNKLEDKDEEITTYSRYVTPPFFEKIYLVWNSPYTKFWMNFLSYILFLALYGVVTIWPCCGHLILDSVLWLWTGNLYKIFIN
jgi:hypothetical protein